LTVQGAGRYADGVKRLELARIRVCDRCRRGVAELRGPDGETLGVPLDAIRARQLAGGDGAEDCHSLTEVVLAELVARGLELHEVVLDLSDGRVRALLSVARGNDPDVIECTAEEGVALAVRGKLKIYATDEALAHRNARAAKPGPESGPDTVH
jgi:hypothetical protein